jgi:hypothetical protein
MQTPTQLQLFQTNYLCNAGDTSDEEATVILEKVRNSNTISFIAARTLQFYIIGGDQEKFLDVIQIVYYDISFFLAVIAIPYQRNFPVISYKFEMEFFILFTHKGLVFFESHFDA